MTAVLFAWLATRRRSVSFGGAFSCVFQAVAFAGRLQDLAVVRWSVQDGTGQSLTAEHLGPRFERQVRSQAAEITSSSSLPSLLAGT